MMRELKQLRVEENTGNSWTPSAIRKNRCWMNSIEISGSRWQLQDAATLNSELIIARAAGAYVHNDEVRAERGEEFLQSLAANSHQGGIVGNKIPTMVQAVAVSRTHTGTSAAEKFSSWKKTLRGVPDEDGNSVSMLWDAHTDLGTRIDELVQACMTGRAHASLGEDILRNRVLAQVEEVAREYNETVISGLEATAASSIEHSKNWRSYRRAGKSRWTGLRHFDARPPLGPGALGCSTTMKLRRCR